ncbi:MAG: hypothetical protein JRI68_11470 [Deltaproteobacteria bacterium]|nr:hypothetical protein [Deltaproteobacteria bacterium]
MGHTSEGGGGEMVGGAGGSAGGAGGANPGGAGGAGGSGGEDTCEDQGAGELNETIATATLLAGGTDCDILQTAGTIDGPDDVDWYVYVQTDDVLIGCNVNPESDWSVQAGHTLRVCTYVECQVNNESPSTVNCNADSTPSTHDGLAGCCHTLPFNVGIGMTGCPGSEDLLNVYTRIAEPDAPADTCTDYNFTYTF